MFEVHYEAASESSLAWEVHDTREREVVARCGSKELAEFFAEAGNRRRTEDEHGAWALLVRDDYDVWDCEAVILGSEERVAAVAAERGEDEEDVSYERIEVIR